MGVDSQQTWAVTAKGLDSTITRNERGSSL
jgi:hypothetical protein